MSFTIILTQQKQSEELKAIYMRKTLLKTTKKLLNTQIVNLY